MSAKADAKMELGRRINAAANKLEGMKQLEAMALKQFKHACVTVLWTGQPVGEIAGADAVAAFEAAIKKNCAAAIVAAEAELEAVV